MKLTLISTLFASAAAFAPSKVAQSTSAISASLDGIPGALAPMGVFDPLGLADKATVATLARYREAEIARMSDDPDKRGQDIAAGLDRARWLARVVHRLGK